MPSDLLFVGEPVSIFYLFSVQFALRASCLFVGFCARVAFPVFIFIETFLFLSSRFMMHDLPVWTLIRFDCWTLRSLNPELGESRCSACAFDTRGNKMARVKLESDGKISLANG